MGWERLQAGRPVAGVSVAIMTNGDRGLSKHDLITCLHCLRGKLSKPRWMDTPAVDEDSFGQRAHFSHSTLSNQGPVLLSLRWFVAAARAWPITVPTC